MRARRFLPGLLPLATGLVIGAAVAVGPGLVQWVCEKISNKGAVQDSLAASRCSQQCGCLAASHHMLPSLAPQQLAAECFLHQNGASRERCAPWLPCRHRGDREAQAAGDREQGKACTAPSINKAPSLPAR